MVRTVKSLGLESCCTLGMLKDGQAERLDILGGRRLERDDDVDFEPNQLQSLLGKKVGLSFSVANVQLDVARISRPESIRTLLERRFDAVFDSE